MAIAFVQKIAPTSARGAAVNSLTTGNFGSNTTPGNHIIVPVTQWIGGAAAPTSVTDSKGNSYSLGPNSTIQGSCWIGIYYALIGTGGASHNVIIDCADGSYIVAPPMEFSGLAASTPLDLSIVGAEITSGSPVTVDSNPTQNAQADELLIFVAGTAASSGSAAFQNPPTTGYTTNGIENDANTYTAHVSAYKILSSVATQSGSATHSLATSAMKALLASFKMAAAGGSKVPLMMAHYN